MALSADEQRLLDQLEASLRAEDPALARKFQVGSESAATRRPWWVIGVSLLIGIVLLAIGMLLLWPLAIVGFLVMFGGAIFVALRPHSQKSEKLNEPADKSSPW